MSSSLSDRRSGHDCRTCGGIPNEEASLLLSSCSACGGYMQAHGTIEINSGRAPTGELGVVCGCCSGGEGDNYSLSKEELKKLGYKHPDVSSLLGGLRDALSFIELVEAISGVGASDLKAAAKALKRVMPRLEAFSAVQADQYLDRCESLAREEYVLRAKTEAKAQAKEASTWVYFVQDVQAEAIKIGFSKNVESRVAALQTSTTNELKVLACTPGGRKREKELHVRFETHRVQGEWFAPVPELLQYIEALRAEQRAL